MQTPRDVIDFGATRQINIVDKLLEFNLVYEKDKKIFEAKTLTVLLEKPFKYEITKAIIIGNKYLKKEILQNIFLKKIQNKFT